MQGGVADRSQAAPHERDRRDTLLPSRQDFGSFRTFFKAVTASAVVAKRDRVSFPTEVVVIAMI